MSLLAITNAGVLYKDAVFAGEEVQNITQVIFRNIVGLEPETAIDLAQGVPSTDIVHTNPIERVAALDGNTIVMSTVLGYDIGDFQYNWYGVIAQKADLSEVLIAVVQTPVQTKTKTEGATTGNYSTKSIVWKTANIAMTLNVTLSALPWQMADNTFVTQAAYDLAMAEKLDKNATADNALKLEGKDKAQVIAEARTGMAAPNHTHDFSYLDKGHWPTIANHTDADHDIIFKSGKVIDSTAQLGINLASDLVKRLDGAWAAGSGNGGLFSGSIAANETYHCFAIQGKAQVQDFADYGTSFTNLGAQFSAAPWAIACSAGGAVVYVTDATNESLYRSTNSGTSFTNLGAQFSTYPWGAACSADGAVVYVTDINSNSLYYSIAEQVFITTTVTDTGFSTSATAADIPAGYTAYRRIGSVLTDSSENIIQFFQQGDYFGLKEKVRDVTDTAKNTANTAAITAPAGLVNLQADIWCRTTVNSDSTTAGFLIASVYHDDVVVSSAGRNLQAADLGQNTDYINSTAALSLRLALDETRSVRYRATSTQVTVGIFIHTLGWWDDRSQ